MPNRHILGDIGYMAQSDALYEALSGQENLEFFGQLKGLCKKVLNDEIAHVAQVVDLTAHLKQVGIWLFRRDETTLVASHRTLRKPTALDFG